jgi:hypothetical protein
MQKNPQRPLNSSTVAKHIVPIMPGMRSQQAAPRPLSAVILDDEQNPPLKTAAAKIPLHPSTPKHLVEKVHPTANNADAVWANALNLGKGEKT